MDFLEGLFDLGDCKHRKKGAPFQNEDHHDNDHDDDHDHHQQYPVNPAPQVLANQLWFKAACQCTFLPTMWKHLSHIFHCSAPSKMGI
jgi:hypothetical protein